MTPILPQMNSWTLITPIPSILKSPSPPESHLCSLCQSSSHINCLNLYTPSDLEYATNPLNHWSCPTCLKENFPFYQIDTHYEFLSLTSPYLLLDHPNLDELIFNPYDLNDEEGGVLEDIDPDSNFYNTHHQNAPNSPYLHISDINKKNPKKIKIIFNISFEY